MISPELVSMDICDSIRSRRRELHLTQDTVARRMKRIGYSWHASTVSALERGKRPLRSEELVGLSVILECTPGSLLPEVLGRAG